MNYENISQAIDLCARTYKDHIYVVRAEESTTPIFGTAYDIYQLIKQIPEELGFYPMDDNDIIGWALLDVIYTVIDYNPPKTQWQQSAHDLINQIIKEAATINNH